jgi:hypothetical protein
MLRQISERWKRSATAGLEIHSDVVNSGLTSANGGSNSWH